MVDQLLREATITGHDAAARTITVRLLRWDDARLVRDLDGRTYREQWARGSLQPAPRMFVFAEHPTPDQRGRLVRGREQLIGRMTYLPDQTGDGPVADLHIAHTRAGDDMLALVDAEVVDSVSLEATPDRDEGEEWSQDRSSVTRTRATLTGVVLAAHPQHDAPILARQETQTMPEIDTTATVDQPTNGASATAHEPVALARSGGVAAPAPVGLDELHAEVVAMRAQLVADREGPTGASATPRCPTWGALMRANAAGELSEADQQMLARALVDTTTADIPGLIPRPQLARVFQRIVTAMPLVEAAGSVPLPDGGMSIDYPSITARPAVGQQVPGEKTEIVSAQTTVARLSTPVVTLAGGEDISIQAILRSSPSYLQLAGLLYAEAMARATDAMAWSIYGPAVPAGHFVSIGTAATGWVAGLAQLAGKILADSLALPNRLVLSPDLWVKFVGAADSDGRPIFPHADAVNPTGSASLASLQGNLRGLAWSVSPALPADRGLFFRDDAFVSMLGPVQTLTNDNARLLGRDYAVFRFGAFAATDPPGLGMFSTGTVTAAAKKAAASPET